MAIEALEVGDVMTPQVVTGDEEAPVTKISMETNRDNHRS